MARELKGRNVLIIDRYEIGERATSACAAPTPWLHAMRVEAAIRQEIPCMAFHTPHGSARFRLPWSWSSFDYRHLCQELYAQTDARFEIAKVNGRTGNTVHTDRGDLTAPHHRRRPRLEACPGARAHPAARRAHLARPRGPPARRPQRTSTSGSTAHSSATATPGASPRTASSGSASAPTSPRHHVKEPTQDIAQRLRGDAVRYQGNWFPHKLQPATEDGIFFAGDSAGHCIPLSGEGIRTAFYFGIAAASEISQVLDGRQTEEQALRRYAAFSRRHAPVYALALQLQHAIPRLPPTALTRLLRLMGRERPCRTAFGWYLSIAPPP